MLTDDGPADGLARIFELRLEQLEAGQAAHEQPDPGSAPAAEERTPPSDPQDR